MKTDVERYTALLAGLLQVRSRIAELPDCEFTVAHEMWRWIDDIDAVLRESTAGVRFVEADSYEELKAKMGAVSRIADALVKAMRAERTEPSGD